MLRTLVTIMGGIASFGDRIAAVMMRCYEMKVEKFSRGEMGESARNSREGRKRSQQSRSPPVGSQTNEKRKIVGQVSSHTRNLKTRREEK
jgi:hypothetical protein